MSARQRSVRWIVAVALVMACAACLFTQMVPVGAKQIPPEDHDFSMIVAANTFVDITTLEEGTESVSLIVNGGFELTECSLRVLVGGRDMTEQVLTSSETRFAVYESTEPPRALDEQIMIFNLNFQGLQLSPGDMITYTAEVRFNDPDGLTWLHMASASSIVIAGTKLLEQECVKQCVCDFVAAVGAAKVNGRTRIDAETTPDDLRQAAENLRNCLQQKCGSVPPALLTTVVTCDNGLKVKINVRAHQGGTGVDSTVEANGGVDLVVAIAGNGCNTGTGRGGNATATNGSAGGAAIAIAGAGSNHGGIGSPGKGGDATSKATGTDSGDAYAIGGKGGNGDSQGGEGGKGEATTTSATGVATAEGGEGGDPVIDSNPGGLGGTATARRSVHKEVADGCGQTLASPPVLPGFHGGRNDQNPYAGTKGAFAIDHISLPMNRPGAPQPNQN